MVSKSLIHSVVTFCNNYINNKHIVCAITIFSESITCNIGIWKVDNYGIINYCKHTYYGYIKDIDDLINYKTEVLKTIDDYINEVTN